MRIDFLRDGCGDFILGQGLLTLHDGGRVFGGPVAERSVLGQRGACFDASLHDMQRDSAALPGRGERVMAIIYR
jgi:hypothetical protein